MKCKKLLALALTAAWFVSACTNVFAAANVSETDAAVDVPQTTISQPAEPEADETAQEVVVTEEETVSVQEKQVQDNEGATSGTCGDSLNWSYNTSTGVLTISGSGTMTSHPWSGYKSTISQIKFSGNITSICTDAFRDCKNLDYVTIPASVTAIYDSAFTNCLNLERVSFSSNSKLTTLGKSYSTYGVFRGCKNLTSIVLPNKLTYVQGYAFADCSNLTSVTIGSSVKDIKEYAFSNCINMTQIKIPANVESIKYDAFYNCSRLVKVELSNGLKEIGENAFRKTALTSITIPSSVTTIHNAAFKDLTTLKTVTFAGNSNLTTLGGYYSSDGVFRGCTNLTSIVLPNKLTYVQGYAFAGCSKLTSVTIGSGVKSIRNYAFSNCVNLTQIRIPASVASIGGYAFYNCSRLVKAELSNGLNEIGENAFRKTALTSITIPSSVTTIHNSAFKDLTTLKTVTFASNSNLATLGDNDSGYGVFEGCTNLSTIVLPDKLTAIRGYTFSKCSSLKKVSVGRHVTSIAKHAFYNCSAMTSIVIPKAVTSIGYNAFYNCSALNTVYYTGSQIQWNNLKSDGISSGGNSYLLNAKNFVYNYSPLASVAVKTKPSKTTYIVGETFSSAGLKLTATYENGTTKVIASGFTCTPSGKLNTLGQQKIVVTYGGKTTAFYVTVNAKQIRVTQKPTKTTYGQGETLNTSGIKVTYTLFDGSTKVVTSGFICTPTKLTTVGTQWITVKFGGTATAFPVKVNEPTVAKIRVTKKPTKTTYVPGNSLNTSGMEVTVTYSNGTTKVITSGFTCTPTKFTAEGLQWITVKYGGTATAFPVNVVKKAKTIRVIQKPTKTTYIVGNSLNTSGLKLRAAYDDGSTKDVTSAFTCYPTKLTTVGTQWITVVYAGQSTAFPIKVTTKPVSSVTIKKLPAKRTYKVGETFNSSGMVLKITYTDNTTAEVTSGFLCTPTGKFTTKGQQKIVVTYGGKSTGFYVTVT